MRSFIKSILLLLLLLIAAKVAWYLVDVIFAVLIATGIV